MGFVLVRDSSRANALLRVTFCLRLAVVRNRRLLSRQRASAYTKDLVKSVLLVVTVRGVQRYLYESTVTHVARHSVCRVAFPTTAALRASVGVALVNVFSNVQCRVVRSGNSSLLISVRRGQVL